MKRSEKNCKFFWESRSNHLERKAKHPHKLGKYPVILYKYLTILSIETQYVGKNRSLRKKRPHKSENARNMNMEIYGVLLARMTSKYCLLKHWRWWDLLPFLQTQAIKTLRSLVYAISFEMPSNVELEAVKILQNYERFNVFQYKMAPTNVKCVIREPYKKALKNTLLVPRTTNSRTSGIEI